MQRKISKHCWCSSCKEREREGARETDRQTDRDRERETYGKTEAGRQTDRKDSHREGGRERKTETERDRTDKSKPFLISIYRINQWWMDSQSWDGSDIASSIIDRSVFSDVMIRINSHRNSNRNRWDNYTIKCSIKPESNFTTQNTKKECSIWSIIGNIDFHTVCCRRKNEWMGSTCMCVQLCRLSVCVTTIGVNFKTLNYSIYFFHIRDICKHTHKSKKLLWFLLSCLLQ